MPRRHTKKHEPVPPQPGWAVYLRTSSDENQKPELSRARQRMAIEGSVLERSSMRVFDEYIDVLTGKTPDRADYQRMLADARAGKFSHVIVERADRFGRDDTEALRAIDELHAHGVAVRFANHPDIDPIDPDGRVMVTMEFSLARRESALLGVRVRGGLKAKRVEGGFCGRAPDGYRNVAEAVTGEAKKLRGKIDHWIERDPERALVIEHAWKLLLQEEMTLEEICETLHGLGYHYRSGRPFVEVGKDGKRKANYSTLHAMFHNWTYAGWLTSKKNKVPPKSIRGDWEPYVSTEDFERGLEILAGRDVKYGRKRKHDYLLKGLIYYEKPSGDIVRLSGQTPNASRSGGGTPYYCIPRSNVNFLCRDVEAQIADKLMGIQVDPQVVPAIRAAYTHEVAAALGHLKISERDELEAALKAVDAEEARAFRLYTAGKVSDALWDERWKEWQDRRAKLRLALDSVSQQRQTHILNLDTALDLITKVGTLYNGLERSDQKHLLHHVVERIIVDPAGTVRLELQSPFAYLHDLSDTTAKQMQSQTVDMGKKSKAGRKKTGSRIGRSSDYILSC